MALFLARKTTLDMPAGQQAPAAAFEGHRHVDMDALKRQAAARALEHVRDGMKLGLGTGSTAKHFVDLLGEKVARRLEGDRRADLGSDPRRRPSAAAFRLTTLDEIDQLDLTVDGADEIDPRAQPDQGRRRRAAAGKDRGGGLGSHDRDRRRDQMGRCARPLSVAGRGDSVRPRRDPAGHGSGHLRESGVSGQMVLRKGKDGHVFVTDGGHWIVDAHLGRIADAPRLAGLLSAIPGVVEHGLFIGLASTVVLAGAQGIRVVERR